MIQKKLFFIFFFSLNLFMAYGSEDTAVSEKGWLTKSLVIEEAIKFNHPYMYIPENKDRSSLLNQYDYQNTDIISFSMSLEEEKLLKPNYKYSARKRKMQRIYIKNSNGEKLKYSIYSGRLNAKFTTESNIIKENQIEFKFFKSPILRPKPLVLVFPPVMGNTPLDKTVAKMLAEHGANVILINLKNLFTENKSVDQLSEEFFQTILLSKMLTKTIIEKYDINIDRNRVGAFGVSLGGIVAATLAGVVEEIQYLYILGAGSNLPDISFSSERASVTLIKDYEFKNNKDFQNLSQLDLKELWFKYTTPRYRILDPGSFAYRLDSEKVFMLMSSVDKTVPFRNQLELWNQLGHPDYFLFNMSHISSIVRWLISKKKHMLDFLLDEDELKMLWN